MTSTKSPKTGSDKAYRALIGHTSTCPVCRTGAACPTAAHLGRAWKAAR
ncbi:hypothetical protein [Streptomyces sp. NPDC059783]